VIDGGGSVVDEAQHLRALGADCRQVDESDPAASTGLMLVQQTKQDRLGEACHRPHWVSIHRLTSADMMSPKQ
jgi:hypothetical protein